MCGHFILMWSWCGRAERPDNDPNKNIKQALDIGKNNEKEMVKHEAGRNQFLTGKEGGENV